MVYTNKPDPNTIKATVTTTQQPEPGPRVIVVEHEKTPQPEAKVFTVQPRSETAIPGRTIHIGDGPATKERPSDFSRPFYTVPQAAELLQVHVNTIYRLLRAGKIEHYKIGVQIRISAAELERLKVERKA